MNKKYKDLISVYMLRNAMGTFITTLIAFLLSFEHYYQCSLLESIQRLFVYDTYTLLYFLLLWLFDYVIFEMSKIVYDLYEEKVTFIPSIVLVIVSIVVFYIPMLDVFQYNICFLCLLITMRMVKEMWKRTPELFSWFHKKRDQFNGLK